MIYAIKHRSSIFMPMKKTIGGYLYGITVTEFE